MRRVFRRPRGARVVVVDTAQPGSGVTGTAFAWISGPKAGGVLTASTPLRQVALEEFHRLQRDVAAAQVRWHGAVSWDQETLENAEKSLGPGQRFITEAQVRRWEPNLRLPPQRAVLSPADGTVDPVAMTEALLQAARGYGARMQTSATVTSLNIDGGAVTGVNTSAGAIRAATVVLAAGTGTDALCAPLGIHLPVAASPAVLTRLSAPTGLVRTLISSPDIEARQTPGGVVLVASDYAGEVNAEDLAATAADNRQRLAATFVGAEQAELLDVRVGQRPIPTDGTPIVGPLPGNRNVYIAVAHPGIILGPIIGRLAADEIVHQQPAEQLHHVRPDRL